VLGNSGGRKKKSGGYAKSILSLLLFVAGREGRGGGKKGREGVMLANKRSKGRGKRKSGSFMLTPCSISQEWEEEGKKEKRKESRHSVFFP